MSYRWYQIPGRGVLMAWALSKSLWSDWFPPKECRTCYYSRDKGLTTLDCTFGCGEGYARAVFADHICEHYRKKRKD